MHEPRRGFDASCAMRAELESRGLSELLGRPRKFSRGDPIPDALPDTFSVINLAIIMSAVGHLLPIPFTGPTAMVLASTMLVPGSTTKRATMRWIADNLQFRHVLVDDTTDDKVHDLLFRFEVNTIGSQWLPLAVFRLSCAEFELGVTAPRIAPADLPTGAVVTLTGLRQRPHLNGARATVRAFDSESARYEVLIESTGELRRLKRTSLLSSDDAASRACRTHGRTGARAHGRTTGHEYGIHVHTRAFNQQMCVPGLGLYVYSPVYG